MLSHVRLMEDSSIVIRGNVHSIESFGSVDGPGIRFIIFLKGCPLRCRYCHNPDAWALPSGTGRTADDLIVQALRFKSYWGRKGGITVSGGEPLVQIDFLIDLCRKAKEEDIHIAIDTSGILFTRQGVFFEKFQELMKYVDLVLLDLKHIDSEKHRWLTGKSNDAVLDCARYLSETGMPVWIRHVLVPGVNDDDASLMGLRAFIDTLSNVERVEVLPYHTLGLFKYEELGLEYGLPGVEPPTAESIAHAESILVK